MDAVPWLSVEIRTGPHCLRCGAALEYVESEGENPDGSRVADNWWVCPTEGCDYEVEAWRV